MTRIRRLVAQLRNLARELSDETAYARYLQINHRTASAAEWKRFSEDRYRRKYENPKCC